MHKDAKDGVDIEGEEHSIDACLGLNRAAARPMPNELSQRKGRGSYGIPDILILVQIGLVYTLTAEQ